MTRLSIPSKLPAVGTTIFSQMSALAAQHNAINLSQGFPDFPVHLSIRERVKQAIDQGFNQYAPMPGLPSLNQQIATLIQRFYGRSLQAHSEITITSGATEALFVAISALVHRGDEVIVFDPAYDSYEPAAVLAGATVKHVPLLPPQFAVDWDAFDAALSPKTKMVVVNTPHNPTGSVWGEAQWQQLLSRIANHHCYVLSDEVYEFMYFDGEPHASAHKQTQLADRCIVVSSFGKTFHATGWKVGYLAANEHISAELRKVHQYVTFAVNTPVQVALAQSLAEEPQLVDELAAFYQHKRDYFRQLLSNSRFSLLPCHGTYFQVVDYRAIAPDTRDVEFCQWLCRQGVAAIPLSVFSEHPDPNQRLIRLCFAKQDSTLEAAAEVLCRL